MLKTDSYQCPKSLLELAESLNPTPTAIVGAHGTLPMKSAKLAQEQNLISPVFVGNRVAILKLAEELHWDISFARIVHAETDRDSADVAAALAGNGEVAALMKGQIHTDEFMHGILRKDTGLRTDRRLIHIFHMTLPEHDTSLMITDGAVNVAPSIDTRLQAAQHAIELSHVLGNNNPKVAVLSGTESPIKSMPSSIEAAEITKRAVNEISGGQVFGPLAFDNAISTKAANLKKINHPVAGNADILLVPNIETGNALFKMMVYFMSACAAGIVLGANVPITLTSRADPPEARVASAALANIVAHVGNASKGK